LNSQGENNGNFKKTYTQKLKIKVLLTIPDFVFRFTYFNVMPYAVTQHHNTIQLMPVIYGFSQ